MPKENRKRGRKHKKSQEPSQPSHDTVHELQNSDHHDRPSWIVSAQEPEDPHPEAPFGYVDPDIKAYFRTVDEQIQTWQRQRPYEEEDQTADLDPNEARRIFLVAALTEMSGKERQLATDPDCSVILERMTCSMDDFVRRVLLDSLCGSYEALIKHRFASHVCQTLFTVSADTVSREARGIYPSTADSADKGELRTLTCLILDICEELMPVFTSLVMDPFASHVLRALLLLLSPSSSITSQKAISNMRSKKSSAWKARQGTMKSVFADNNTHNVNSTRSVPKEFHDAASKLVGVLKSELDDNEVRALAGNKVASPLLQLMLEVEADHDGSSFPGSLMDRVMVGVITLCHQNPDEQPEASDYLVTLLRDPTASHLLETVVSRCPDPAFAILWTTYFSGKLVRLAAHPVANFVVAKAVERLNAVQLKAALEELENSWNKLIGSARTGVLRAMIDRACVLRVHEKDTCQAVCNAFELFELKDQSRLVPCALVLKPLREFTGTHILAEDAQQRSEGDNMNNSKIQGALILQSLLRLNEPYCMIVAHSITSLATEDLISLSQNPISSRVIDALFDSETVPFKVKRSLVMSLIGHYHTLVDDRIGSRVGDRCWAFADPYLREKIARSLLSYEQFLAASYFGKFFSRNINLYLLQRRPDEWRELQSQNKAAVHPAPSAKVAQTPNTEDAEASHSFPSKTSKKRRSRPEDEIDTVFNASLGAKVKRTAIKATGITGRPAIKKSVDQGLQDVLGAIRAAPSADDNVRGKRQRR